MNQLIANYLSYCRDKKLSSNTVVAYQFDLCEFEDSYLLKEGIPPDKVGKEDFLQYLDLLRGKGIQPNSVKRKTATLSGFYSYLEEENIIDITPLYKIKFQKDIPSKKKILTPEEIAAIYEAVQSGRDQKWISIFYLLYGMGLALNELVSLDIDSIFREYVCVTNEKGQTRELKYLNRWIRDALLQYTREREEMEDVESPALFLNRRKLRLGEQSIRAWLKGICSDLRIRYIGPRELRYQFAIDYLRGTGNIPQLSKYLDHVSASYTIEFLESKSREPVPYPTTNDQSDHMQQLLKTIRV